MTQQHPINPPPSELVLQWIGEFFGCTAGGELSDSERFLTTRAAQWGADQELEACCEWLGTRTVGFPAELRSARRPKPPSLKEQGIKSLDNVIDCIKSLVPGASVDGEDIKVIRRALEQLPDHE